MQRIKRKTRRKKAKSPKLLYWILMFGILLSGFMLTLSLFYQGIRGAQGADILPLLRTDTVYIMLMLALLFPIMLIFMIRYVVKRNDHIKDVELAIGQAHTEEEIAEAEAIISEELDYMREEKDLDGNVYPISDRLPSSPHTASDTETVKETEESRFYMLSELDKESKVYVPPVYDNEITLEELCHRFRHFAAGKLHLYYDIADIRRFIAGLAVTHIVIMQGMSGTGKTSLAYAFGEFMQNQSVVVPIQPMWKERTDMIGYYNEFTKRFNETVLLRKMYEANCNDNIYITVLDEMNIARVEYYFAEFLSLLELPNPEQRYLDVVSDKWSNDPELLKNGQIKLPANMWFIGTANNDDSTFAISDKVYDRAMVMNLDQKADLFEPEEAEPVYMSKTHWEALVKEALEEYALSERNRRRLAMLDEYLVEKFRITFGNRIMKQINQYIPVCLACGGNELDALDDILARKVLRKLESQNPVYVRSAADGLCNYLEELFGSDHMTLCKDYLRRLERSA